MVLKVPVYVEIDKIDPDSISLLVDELSDEFYKFLQEKNLKTFIKLWNANSREVGKPESDFKVITKTRAIDHLRKGV
jgi:hypothetical protein